MEIHEVRAVVGRNVRAFAKERRITLNRLIDFAETSKGQLYNVLRGTTSPTVDWLTKVANALEVEPWQLLAPRPKKSSARSGR